MEINNCEIKDDEILFKNTKCQRIPLSRILNMFFSLDEYKTYKVLDLYEYIRSRFNINLHKASFLSLFNNKKFILIEDVSFMIKSIFKTKKFKSLYEMIIFLFVDFNYFTLSIIKNYGLDFILSIFKRYFQKREGGFLAIIEKLINSKSEDEWINLISDSKTCCRVIDQFVGACETDIKLQKVQTRVFFNEIHKDNLNAKLKFLCSDKLYNNLNSWGRIRAKDLLNTKIDFLLINKKDSELINELEGLETKLKDSLVEKFNEDLLLRLSSKHCNRNSKDRELIMPVLDRLCLDKSYAEIAEELQIHKDKPRRLHLMACYIFECLLDENAYIKALSPSLTFIDENEFYKKICPQNPNLIKQISQTCVTYSNELNKYIFLPKGIDWYQDKNSEVLLTVYRPDWDEFEFYGTWLEFFRNNKKYLKDSITREDADRYVNYLLYHQIYSKGYIGLSKKDLLILIFGHYKLTGDIYKKRKSRVFVSKSKILSSKYTREDKFLYVLNQVCPNRLNKIDDHIIFKLVKMYPFYYSDEISYEYVLEMCKKVKYYDCEWKLNTEENDINYIFNIENEFDNLILNNLEHYYNLLAYYNVNEMDINNLEFVKSFREKSTRRYKHKNDISLEHIKKILRYLMFISQEAQCINPKLLKMTTYSYNEYGDCAWKYKEIDFDKAPLQYRKIVKDDGMVFLFEYENYPIGHVVIANVTNKRKYWETKTKKIYYPVETAIDDRFIKGNFVYIADRLVENYLRVNKINYISVVRSVHPHDNYLRTRYFL